MSRISRSRGLQCLRDAQSFANGGRALEWDSRMSLCSIGAPYWTLEEQEQDHIILALCLAATIAGVL